MRICLISTFPPIECGIATYTEFLVEAMKRRPNEVHVVSQYGAEGEHVYPVYDANDTDIAHRIFDMTVKVTPDVVHIQHEFGLYGETHGIAVLELIYRFKASGLPVIATFHTVHDAYGDARDLVTRVMCRELDAMIVHEEDHRRILVAHHGPVQEKIHMIPHGARLVTPVQGAKEQLGLGGKKVVLLAGYFRPTKCFERVVEIFPEIVASIPDAWLVLSGKMRRIEFGGYRQRLFEKINASPVKDHIEVFRGQFPQQTLDTIISACDVMVFPYSVGAQSGMMSHAMAFGKPVVTSDLPAFVSMVEKSRSGFSAKSDGELASCIMKLLSDGDLYREKQRNALEYVRRVLSWDIVAEKTQAVYNQFQPRLECRTRYIYVG